MKVEEAFGMNAGRVWQLLKSRGSLNAASIARDTQLKIEDVFGALGWLGREGKLEIIVDEKRGGTLYKLK